MGEIWTPPLFLQKHLKLKLKLLDKGGPAMLLELRQKPRL